LIEAGLIAARFLNFATVMALFGLALFPLYGYSALVGEPPQLRRWLRVSPRCAALLALLSGLAWGWFLIANMTGALSSAADWESMRIVLREANFGQVWVARLALSAVVLALMTRGSDPEYRLDWMIVVLTAALLASLALTGHTQTNEGALRIIHVAAAGAHLLAAGAWLGGLLQLAHLVGPGCNFDHGQGKRAPRNLAQALSQRAWRAGACDLNCPDRRLPWNDAAEHRRPAVRVNPFFGDTQSS
jgi:putative copper resistance protein D